MSFAVVGAAAMAAYGVARSTQDVDVLSLDARCLTPATWASLTAGGAAVNITRGDDSDPLAGVVQISDGDALLDVIIGRSSWQAGMLDRARPQTVEGILVPVVRPADLNILKLYAAGPQDAWDIEQLLAAGDRAALTAEVEAALAFLSDDSRRLWARIVRPR